MKRKDSILQQYYMSKLPKAQYGLPPKVKDPDKKWIQSAATEHQKCGIGTQDPNCKTESNIEFPGMPSYDNMSNPSNLWNWPENRKEQKSFMNDVDARFNVLSQQYPDLTKDILVAAMRDSARTNQLLNNSRYMQLFDQAGKLKDSTLRIEDPYIKYWKQAYPQKTKITIPDMLQNLGQNIGSYPNLINSGYRKFQPGGPTPPKINLPGYAKAYLSGNQGDIPKSSAQKLAELQKIDEYNKQREAYLNRKFVGPTPKLTPYEEAQRQELKRKKLQEYAAMHPEQKVNEFGELSLSPYGEFIQKYGDNLDKFAESWETPLAIQGVGELAYGLGRLGIKYAPQAAEYLTTRTPLRNVSKLNPFAGTFAGESKLPKFLQFNKLDDPNAFWRLTKNPETFGLGEGAYFNKGVPLTGELAETFPKGSRAWQHRYSGPIWNPETKKIDLYNGPDYLFKVKDESLMEPHLNFPESHLNFFRQSKNVPQGEAELFKKDWLHGWKKQPYNTPTSTQSIIRGPIPAPYPGNAINVGAYGENVVGKEVPEHLRTSLIDEARNPMDIEDAFIKPVVKRIPSAEELALSKRLKDRNQRIIDALKNKNSSNFKSEIDWSKWNSDTPKYPELINEYNAIEESTKKAGTWMKNTDGSPFQGTPEQFVQQNSQNFKKAFPNILKEDDKVIKLIHHSKNQFDIFDKSKNLSGTGKNLYGEGVYAIPEPFYNKRVARSTKELMDNSNTKDVLTMYGNNRYDLYTNNNGLNKVAYRNRFEVTPDTRYEDIFTVVAPYENQLKSAVGNNGMFDMSNPNIYKAVVPTVIGTSALQKKKEGGLIKAQRGRENILIPGYGQQYMSGNQGDMSSYYPSQKPIDVKPKEEDKNKTFQNLRSNPSLKLYSDKELKQYAQTPRSNWPKFVKESVGKQENTEYNIVTHPDYDPNVPTSKQTDLAYDNSLRTMVLRGRNKFANSGNPAVDVANSLWTAPGSAFANMTMNAEKSYFNPNNSFLENAGNFAMDATMLVPSIIPKAASAINEIPTALKSTGQYLTTQTPLRNAYKINPWAFKPNESNWYRQVGKSAIDDAFNTGVVREAGEEVSPRMLQEFEEQLVRMQGSGPEAMLAGRRPISPFFAKGELFYPMGRKPIITNAGKISKNPAGKGSADYLIETNLSNESFQPAYVKGMTLGVPEEIGSTAILKPNPSLRNLENFKLYKQNWLKGYKPVEAPKPTSSVENIVRPKISPEKWKDMSGFLQRRQFIKQLQSEALIGKKFDDLNYAARSTDKTNALTKLALDRYHTGFRNVKGEIPKGGVGRQSYTGDRFDMNKPAWGQTISEMENMKNAGVDFSDPKSIAEYQATHIPLQDYGYRSTGEHPTPKYGFLFRNPGPSNSTEYGKFQFKGIPKTDFSAGNYEDWFKTYYKDLKYHTRGNALSEPVLWENRIMRNKSRGIGDVTFVGPRGTKAYEIDKSFPFQNLEEVKGNPELLKAYEEYLNKYRNQFKTGWKGEYKQGGVVKDDMGYWNPENWGKVVEIDSPDITMQGVTTHDLVGISDKGDVQYMEKEKPGKPGKNYKFKGKKVTEYPVMQKGGKTPYKNKAFESLLNPFDLYAYQKFNEEYPVKKMQSGGEQQKKGSYVDSVLNANKNLNWVQRLYDKNPKTIQIPGEKGRSTHFMEYSDNRVYPTVVQMPNGQLKYLGDKAYDYADSTKTFIKFPTDKEAQWFGENYKKGKNVLRGFKKGGSLTPNKAREILHDKSVHGHPLTDKQRRFFGAMSKGHTNKFQGGGPYERIKLNYADLAQFGSPLNDLETTVQQPVREYNKPLQTQFDEAIAFQKGWMGSPRYKEMITSSLGNQKDEYSNRRLSNLSNVSFKYNPKQATLDRAGESDNRTGNITVFPEAQNLEGTMAHELSHSSDRPVGFAGKRIIPQIDIDKIKAFVKENRKAGLYSTEKYPTQSKKVINSNIDYLTTPTETRARLNHIRQFAKDYGIYDPFTQKVTPEIFDKLKNTLFERKDRFDPMLDLKQGYTDDQIMDMLNSISKVKTNNVNEKASYGGMFPSTGMQVNIKQGAQFPRHQYGGTQAAANGGEDPKPTSTADFLKSMANSPLFGQRYAAMIGKNFDQVDKKEIDDYRNYMLSNLNTLKYAPVGEIPFKGAFDDATLAMYISPKDIQDRHAEFLSKINTLEQQLPSFNKKQRQFVQVQIDNLKQEAQKNYQDELGTVHKIYTKAGINSPYIKLHEESHGTTQGRSGLKFGAIPFKYDPSRLASPFREEFEKSKEYLTTPTEQKARRDVLAKYMMDEGIWDPINKPFTKENLDALKSSIKALLRKDRDNPGSTDLHIIGAGLDTIHPYSSDEEIIRMFNSFVKAPTKTSVNRAEYGGYFDAGGEKACPPGYSKINGKCYPITKQLAKLIAGQVVSHIKSATGKSKSKIPYKEVDASSANTFRDILPVPDNVAQMLAKTVYKDARMNNESLDDEQKLILWNTIQNAMKRTGKGSGGTEYQDYGNIGYGTPEFFNESFNKGKGDVLSIAKNSIFNKGYRLASTVGRGRYWTDPKDPDIIYYTDVYDWNPHEKNFKGNSIYKNLRNTVRDNEDKNLNPEKNNMYRMNFKLNRKDINSYKNLIQQVQDSNNDPMAAVPIGKLGGDISIPDLKQKISLYLKGGQFKKNK